MNKENLALLANWIETNVTQEHFDMGFYRSHEGSIKYFVNVNDCGTCGCCLGWGPFVPGLEVIEDDFKIDDLLSFYHYGQRIFELTAYQHNFIFDGSWARIDNSVEGAVKRVRYLINNPELEDIKLEDTDLDEWHYPSEVDVPKYQGEKYNVQ